MKTTKKLFSFFLAVVLVFGAIPIVNTQAPFSILSFASERDITDSGNINSSIQWMLYSDGELVISGSGNMPDFPELPPWFAYRDMITSISVNEGITSIGGYAFLALYNTVSVTLPEGITSIGGSSFEKMLRLKKINIPSTVKSIDLYAFNSCLSLEEIPLIEIKEYKDEQSGVIILADKEAYNGKDISFTVEEVFDGSHYLGISYGNVESWNITTYIDGEEAQPSTPVYVKIPLPDNFNEKKCTVYHINSQTNQKEKIASDVIDGYICFYAESFSIYIVVDESSAIENPAENCDHICHKSGFLGFIWKIIVFFSKLFKINPVCDCGTAHY